MKRFLMVSTVLVLSIGAGAPAMGQEKGGGGADDSDILVTARKQSESIREIPDSIQAFSATAIERAGISSINDLSTVVSGFHIVEAQQPGVALINVRGIGQVRNGEAPIAVVIDGVQQISANQLTQELFDIEQIEFLKGPQGALYGRNALGGAINIVTRQPGNEFMGSVEAGYAQGDDFRLKGYISAPLGDKAGLRLAAGYRNRDGQIYNSTLDTDVDFDKTANVRASLRLTPSERLKIDLTGSYLDQKAGASYYRSGPPNASREPVVANLLGEGKRDLGDTSARIEFDLGGATLQSVSAYSSVRSDLFEELDWEAADLLAATQTLKVDAVSEELRLSSSDPGARLRWVTGVYYLHTRQTLETIVFLQPGLSGLPDPIPASILRARDRNNAYAAFGQFVYGLSDRFELTGALRYDIDRRSQTDLQPPTPTSPTRFKATFRSLQPKLSLAYKFPGGGLGYATVAKGFRSGGFNANAVVTRQFEKEELWNYELGFKSILADRKLFINGAAFYTPIDDRQVYGLDLTAGAAQFIANPIPKSHILGAEIEMTARPAPGLDLSFGATLLDTKIDRYDRSVFAGTAANGDYKGNKLSQAPGYSLNAAIQYTAELKGGSRLVSRFDVSGSGGDFYWEIDNADRREAVWLANARLAWVTDRFELSVYATNLFNRQYDLEFVPPAFSGIITGLGVGARGAPRQIGASAKAKF